MVVVAAGVLLLLLVVLRCCCSGLGVCGDRERERENGGRGSRERESGGKTALFIDVFISFLFLGIVFFFSFFF